MKKRAHKKLVKKILNNPVVRLKWFIEHNHAQTTPTYKDYIALDKQSRVDFIKEYIAYLSATNYVCEDCDTYFVLLDAYDERRSALVTIRSTLRDADGFIDSYEVIELSKITNCITHNRKKPSKITKEDIDKALDFIHDIQKMLNEIKLDELD